MVGAMTDDSRYEGFDRELAEYAEQLGYDVMYASLISCQFTPAEADAMTDRAVYGGTWQPPRCADEPEDEAPATWRSLLRALANVVLLAVRL